MKSTGQPKSPRWFATAQAGFRSKWSRKNLLPQAFFLVLGLVGTSAYGTDLDLFNDSFDSSTGPLLGTTPGLGGPWFQTGTNSSNPIQLAGGTVTLNGIGQDAYASLASPVANRAGTELRTSLDLNVLAAQPAGDYFLHLSNPLGTTFNFYQRLFARSSENGYQLGLLDTAGSGSVTTWGTQELSFGASHHVDIVWHFSPSGTRNDTLSLSLDGNPYLTHSWTSTIVEPSELAAVNFRQGNATTTVPWVTLDNLRITALAAPPAPYNIFQWEYINPASPSQGKQQSTLLAPDGYGMQAGPGLNAAGSNLTKSFLIGANLTNAAFQSANLTDASLSQANLTNADLSGANLSGADLTGALIQGAQFYGLQGGSVAQLYSTASYQAHDLRGIGLGGNSLPGANFAGQNLSTATFQSATLTRANFKQANLTGANLTGANLTGATIVAANLTDAVVKNAKLSSTHITLDQLYSTASYRNHDLNGVHFIGNDLSGADFSHQALGSASFYAAKLVGADFTNADLNNAELVNADLSGADLTGANFTYATLALANLNGANLAGANLSGTNMIGANFSGADIRGANLSKIISFGGGSDGRPCGCGIIWWPTPLPNPTYQIIGSGINLSQLASTASYAERDLAGTTFMNNNFNSGNFAGFNLTNTNFYGTTLVDADLTGADARGAVNLYITSATNFIYPDGRIAGVALGASQTLSIRDYDGSPTSGALPIRVDQQLTMAHDATLQMIFDADTWSTLR